MTSSAQTHPPEAPKRRIAVIVNGNAKSVTEEILRTLDQILEGGDLFVSRSIEEGREIAATVLERGYGTVLTGGGDGTFTALVSDVVKMAREQGKKPPRFGLLRLGTGNALSWVVGASEAARGKGLAADIQRLRADAGARPMRLIEVEDRIAPFCGFGIDANVLADFHKVRDGFRKLPIARRLLTGLPSYAVAATTMSLPAYLVKPIPFVRVINEGSPAEHLGDNGRPLGAPIPKGELIYEGKARMVSASTIPYYGFGFRVFPYADERPDRMALRITTIGSIEFLANFPTRYARGGPLSVDAVLAALDEANRAVIGRDEARRMGTTVTGLASLVTPAGAQVMVFNVGDSRVYRLAGDQFGQLTVDHSEVQELVLSGAITPEQARIQPRRNIVTRALGSDFVVQPDHWLLPPLAGDRYLVCSDGLTGELTDEEILPLLLAGDPQQAAAALVAAADEAGGHDNTTVIVVDVAG